MLYQKPYKYGRICFVAALLIVSFTALCVRLVYIAHIAGPDFAIAAVNQRRRDVDLRRERGAIYDRNMLPLTDSQIGLSVAVTTEMLAENPEFTAEILRNLNITRNELNDILQPRGVQLLPLNTIDERFINSVERVGTRIIAANRRHSDNQIANHVIGYSPQHDGAAGFGIERAFDDILSRGGQSIGIIRDFNDGFPLSNIGQSRDSERGGIRLTLDFHMQQAVESVMDEMVERGAVVVADVLTGDILAMASRGNFSQNNLHEHLQSDDGELINRAITAFDAGSIFKIVTAAAAIENGLISDEANFFCGGYINIDGRQFACNNRAGHGFITFEQAFAYSCNIPFYRLGVQLGYDLLNEYSRKFGLDELMLNLDNFGEAVGTLPARRYVSNSLLANMSIGQGDTLLTPVQVTNMVNIIANRGIAVPLNLVDAYVDRFGNIQENFKNGNAERAIDENTADMIATLMASTVEFGTGRRAAGGNFTAAGKTSSAETGWMEDGEFKIHAWFAGYAPAENPRFTITVFVQNGRQGATAAAPVFREISERLFDIGR